MTTILLTGASRGIGAAARAQLALDGAIVIGHSSAAAGNEGADEGLLGADFRDPHAPRHLWEAALERADGRIDVVINNAGLFAPDPVSLDENQWLANWRETLDINLTAAALLSRLAINHWRQNAQAGRLVHIASRAGHRGDSPDHWHYAASKGGMLAMHKTIARAYARENILSFAIAPGFTDTAMADDYLESRGGEKLLADIPLGKVAAPEEIAQIIAFCALDAPASMTGAVIDANGASYVR